MGKKKGVSGGLSELITSAKRHYNNVRKDPERQKIINLYLGIFIPKVGEVPIWNIEDVTTHEPVINNTHREKLA